MKNVLKSLEPEELKKYKTRFSSQFKRWSDLKSNRDTFNAVRNTLSSDQKGLCAYCEMSLHQTNRSVDHFIPRGQSTPEKNYDLDWQNMLAICLPPGGLNDDDLQNLQLPHNSPCCGKKKDNISDGQLLNPLELPTLRLFEFSSKDGEIRPDKNACMLVGIPVESAQFTIEILGLNVPRLKDQRLVVIEEITKELDDETIDINDLEEKLAAEYFGDDTTNWPRFFTTIRWILGAGAERHLSNIYYSG
ncbi:retron system putative HNH endonuclease [Cronbergia sp. UHCC 0137]|uniref:retron system putative HNH endonuclease n=1 Tax=Cronbergia sp. UHCC 0137 TaxID=3110239 RepID=UPI002B1EAAC8|nr:retron system putative HNH endonuclease [Cronbergia sp. UHCC 0137]MEA5618018.1 retron system putative HNH endonuclease [Cronbergia sp. UHCC 0137]